MADEPENLILTLLREMRADMGEIRAQIAVLAQGQVTLRNEFRTEMKQVRDEIKQLKEEVKDIRIELSNIRVMMGEVAIAVDGHGVRLERLETHAGLPPFGVLPH